MIQTEVMIWGRIRRRQIGGWKFRRQHPIGPYVVDFYCPAAKLVVEINGRSHENALSESYDRQRQERLERQGLQVLNLSFESEEVTLDDLVATIEEALQRTGEAPVATPPSAAPTPPHTVGRRSQVG